MDLGLQLTIDGANPGTNFGLRDRADSAIDAAALAFGESRVLSIISPRHVLGTADNPSGRYIGHNMVPYGDTLYFNGTGITVAPLSGFYGGKKVFNVTRSGTAAAGSHNDLTVNSLALAAKTSFSIFFVARIPTALLGTNSGTTHPIVGLYRGSTGETVVSHFFNGGVNFLFAQSDAGEAGGASVDLGSTALIDINLPFVGLVIVKASRTSICINSISEQTADTSANAPEAGINRILIGHGITDAQQFLGEIGDVVIIDGDVRADAENQNKATTLINAMMSYYSVTAPP